MESAIASDVYSQMARKSRSLSCNTSSACLNAGCFSEALSDIQGFPSIFDTKLADLFLILKRVTFFVRFGIHASYMNLVYPRDRISTVLSEKRLDCRKKVGHFSGR